MRGLTGRAHIVSSLGTPRTFLNALQGLVVSEDGFDSDLGFWAIHWLGLESNTVVYLARNNQL